MMGDPHPFGIAGYDPDAAALDFSVDGFIRHLQQPGNEADAWRVVEALAPKLAGPWEAYDGRMSRPKYVRWRRRYVRRGEDE